MAEATAARERILTDHELVERFAEFVGSKRFPCVGAKSALNRNQIRYTVEQDLRCGPSRRTLSELQLFGRKYSQDAPLFQSFVVLFRGPRSNDEREFERYLWRYLQRLHDMDRVHFDWDASVASNPSDVNFSFSIGGKAYYVVGLHPGASRSARRFSRPALVFNLHDQFERLRAEGRYEDIRDTIVKRDVKIQGSRNPMLKQFGTSSEARQYSGRSVDEHWKCPFHAK